jgi:hypothetical protein
MTGGSPHPAPFPTAEAAVLDAWADAWGADPLRVQGPGANLSLKHGPTMRIKASGARLDAREDGRLWTDVDLRSCVRALPPPRPGRPGRDAETAYANAVIQAPLAAGTPRPSMELGMHATLAARCVVHLHSLAGVLLAAMSPRDPRSLDLLAPVRAAGFAVRRVPAVRPGLALTWAVAARADPRPRATGTLFLLAGHGLIWVSDDPDRITTVEAMFEAAARRSLDLALPVPACRTVAGGLDCDFRAWPDFVWDPRPAFPDFAVFFPDPARRPVAEGRIVHVPSGPTPRDAAELVFAQAVLSVRARSLGLDVALPARVADTVAALQLEHLRRAPTPRSP